MWINTFESETTTGFPHLITFYEPLPTSAPWEAYPYCCYIRTVIFYKPPFPGNLEIIDQIETQWDLLGERYTDQIEGWAALAPFVYHEGQVYELCSGQVIWRNGQWVMKRGSRRVREDDRRWPFITVPEGVE